MAKVQEIGPYSAYAIAVKYGYKGTEEEWVKEQEANRKAAEAAAAAAAQSAKDAAASASGVAQSGQQAVQGIKDAQTAAEQAIDTAKQQAVQAAQAEAEKAATSAGQAASSAAEAAQSATNAAAEVGKVQSAGTSAVQAVQAAQNTATEAVSAAQQTATQAVSQAQTAAVSAVQEAGTTQTSAVASAASSALSGIADAKDAALSDVAQAGAEQVSAVGTAGTSAVQDVNDAKTAALEEIDAANAALPSPTQSDAGKVPTVKADGSAYELAGPYAPLNAAIRPTASGNPVNITDSVEWPLQGLKVYGKSTQDGTPSPENPVPISSAGQSGAVNVTVCGINLLDTSGLINNMQYLPSTGEISPLNGRVSTPKISNPGLPIYIYVPSGNFPILTQFGDTGKLISRTFPNPNTKIVLDAECTNFAVTVYTYQNDGIVDFDALKKNMVISLKLVDRYYPYVTPQQLPLSTPSGLPGIPVDSGGNYTDAEGQQRVCNYKDYAREVYVQRVEQFTFDGSSDELWTMETNAATQRNYFSIPLEKAALRNSNGDNVLLCQAFKYMQYGYNAPSGNNTACFQSSNLSFICSTSLFNSVDDWRQYLIGNPMTLIYAIANPIETPISPEELAAYRALHTYDGATVVSTAEDVAGIEVRYVADGEKYIDRKISEGIASAAETKLASYDTLSGAIHEGVNEA